METAISSATICTPSSLFMSSPAIKKKPYRKATQVHMSSASQNEQSDHDPRSEGTSWKIVSTGGGFSSLSKDAAIGLVLNSASVRGWTTGSGMEGPPFSCSETEKVSTFPWSLFTKSPRRRMLLAFTCNVCGQRTTRAVNPLAYTDGTVFVQCCGCNIFHKLVDNLNLFHEMKCYVNPSFKQGEADVDDFNPGA